MSPTNFIFPARPNISAVRHAACAAKRQPAAGCPRRVCPTTGAKRRSLNEHDLISLFGAHRCASTPLHPLRNADAISGSAGHGVGRQRRCLLNAQCSACDVRVNPERGFCTPSTQRSACRPQRTTHAAKRHAASTCSQPTSCWRSGLIELAAIAPRYICQIWLVRAWRRLFYLAAQRSALAPRHQQIHQS